MTEKMLGSQYTPNMETGIEPKDTDAEFNAIIAAEFETRDSIDNHDEPFLMRRMVLKDVVVFDNRHMQPSTNRDVTWSPTDDGRERVDAVTYGDND